jgi:hypothetical protein
MKPNPIIKQVKRVLGFKTPDITVYLPIIEKNNGTYAMELKDKSFLNNDQVNKKIRDAHGTLFQDGIAETPSITRKVFDRNEGLAGITKTNGNYKYSIKVKFAKNVNEDARQQYISKIKYYLLEDGFSSEPIGRDLNHFR